MAERTDGQTIVAEGVVEHPLSNNATGEEADASAVFRRRINSRSLRVRALTGLIAALRERHCAADIMHVEMNTDLHQFFAYSSMILLTGIRSHRTNGLWRSVGR